jgi:predicted RNA-binding protein YlxR (DUF448 family)
LRFVAAPDKTLLLDYRQRLPGRGCYTCCTQICIRNAVKKNAFKRALRSDCHGSDTERLQQLVVEAVAGKIANLLGMARKAGLTVCGTAAVKDSLTRPGPPALMILAVDISSAFADKLEELASKREVEWINLFTKERIGQLHGQDQYSALAVRPGLLAEKLLSEVQRYKQLVREN